MQLIENTKALEELCTRLNQNPFVCIDLEFLRRQTYFAKLCLIQIADTNEAAIIDPLAPDIDLTPFFNLLQNPNIVKVFHSGRQDIEILYNLTSQIPFPYFDTQIAAMAAGYGETVSYEFLVNHILNKTIDKSSRLSDWSKRPLSQNQLSYALSDVTHLVHIYTHLKNWLASNNRTNWIDEELSLITDEKLYQINPEEMWQKIRHRSHSAHFLTILKELASWREKRAINKNVPRQSFIKDDTLLNICANLPSNKEELCSIQGLSHDLASGKIGDEIISVIQNFKLLGKENYVTPPKIKDLPSFENSLFELIKLALKLTAQEHKISPRLIASEDDLKIFCHDTNKDTNFLHGWRYEIFGSLAQKISLGQTTITYDPVTHSIKFTDLSK